jgi:hypothetical protein
MSKNRNYITSNKIELFDREGVEDAATKAWQGGIDFIKGCGKTFLGVGGLMALGGLVFFTGGAILYFDTVGAGAVACLTATGDGIRNIANGVYNIASFPARGLGAVGDWAASKFGWSPDENSEKSSTISNPIWNAGKFLLSAAATVLTLGHSECATQKLQESASHLAVGLQEISSHLASGMSKLGKFTDSVRDKIENSNKYVGYGVKLISAICSPVTSLFKLAYNGLQAGFAKIATTSNDQEVAKRGNEALETAEKGAARAGWQMFAVCAVPLLPFIAAGTMTIDFFENKSKNTKEFFDFYTQALTGSQDVGEKNRDMQTQVNLGHNAHERSNSSGKNSNIVFQDQGHDVNPREVGGLKPSAGSAPHQQLRINQRF